MSINTRFLPIAASAVKRTVPRLLSRQYSDSPYPFTKPSPNVAPDRFTEAPGSGSPYPFTKPEGAAEATRPTDGPARPVSGPGLLALSEEDPVESPAETMGHKPDYNVAADYRTSAFSPIPLRVMDGSEEGDTVPAAILSGAPTDLQARTVRIYKPAKAAAQSGDWHGRHWRMDWDILQKGHRWENPLMGWQSSADFMQGEHLNFETKDDAIRFAEKQGYEYFVQEPNEKRRIPKAYASQFVHIPGKLKEVRTK